MKKTRKIASLTLAMCLMFTLCNNALAVNSDKWDTQINIMTSEQREEMQNQSKNNIKTANAYLSKNNQDGTNGNICSEFIADKTSIAFVLTNAPGATNYNIQLYEGKAGEGKIVSNYATVNVNDGVYFTGLTIGKEYYMKISSSTLSTNGCTATYETVSFNTETK